MLKLHDLYGQSFAHEFKFSNPDSIRNAVKRYNLQRAAERDEYKKDRETHKLCKPRFCKMRNTGHDVLSMVTSRDLDVETQMSLQSKDLSDVLQEPINSSSCSCVSHSSNNNSSDSEPENGLELVKRLVGGADSMTLSNSKTKNMRNRKLKRGAAKQKVLDSDPYAMHIEGLHREVCAELQYMGQTQSELRIESEKSKQKPLRNPKQPIKSKPKRVLNQPTNIKKLREKPVINPESSFNISEPDMILQRLKEVLSTEEPHKAIRVSYEDTPQPQGQWMDIIPSPIIPHPEDMNVCESLNTTLSSACFMEHHVNEEPDPLEPYFIEDSDLEQEYADRPGYMRYVQRHPYNLSEPDNVEDDDQQKLSFVELGPHPHWISLQRSMKPMHYTSQRSDTDTCTLCGQEEQLLYSKNVYTAIDQTTGMSIEAAVNAAIGVALGTPTGNPATARQQQPLVKRNRRTQPPSPEPHTELGAKVRTPRTTQLPQSARGRQPKRKLRYESPVVGKIITRQHGGGDKDQKATVPAPLPTEQPQQQPQPLPQTMNQPQTELSTAASINPNLSPNLTARRRKTRTVPCTRSLENLKYQKMSIYNKISLTQERIIGALDRLQSSLLQLPLISNNTHEKQRRERNAFNFCVRFSRNFLYPLRGMIEDVRCTPVASFNSATSNEASQRVVCVYGLMHHSVGRYQRQVRYFLLDKVPQKLSALIEMMYTLTNVCLEKGVLDRQDPVVECLQQRCTSFLTFIEDMQEQRFQLARETYRRLQRRVHGSGQVRPGINERYDLKMCLNDFKLYEPRLVPKERSEKRRHRVWLRKQKLITDPITPHPVAGVNLIQPTEAQQEQPTEDVPTHIECVQCGDYRGDLSSDLEEPSEDQKNQLSNILALLQEPGREKRKLQQLLEAMEHVTKSKVREVLDPLVRSLGAMLDKKIPEETQ